MAIRPVYSKLVLPSRKSLEIIINIKIKLIKIKNNKKNGKKMGGGRLGIYLSLYIYIYKDRYIKIDISIFIYIYIYKDRYITND